MPALPAARGVARARGAGEAGGASATRTTGAGRWRASATPRRACTCSGWRPRPTAATAPGGCSPATAPATGCSPRCTGPGSPTSPPRLHRDDGLQLTGRVRRGRRPLRAAGQQAAPGRARQLPALRRPRAGAAARPRDRLPRRVRLGRRAAAHRAAHPRRGRASATRAEHQLGRRPRAAGLLPPEPAEHVHRPAHRGDDRRGAGAGGASSGVGRRMRAAWARPSTASS